MREIIDKKQKEALIIALAEKGKTYREITKEAGVSPNTIKAVLNRTGLDETTSTSSRAFELFSEGKTPLQVAVTLNLEAKEAIRYHQEYFMNSLTQNSDSVIRGRKVLLNDV